MLETLVHGQDDHAAGARQFAMVQQPGQVVQGAGVIASVPA
jgi:hypothetical protein